MRSLRPTRTKAEPARSLHDDMNREPEAAGGFWRERARSFVHAGRGVAELLRNHPNARLHLVATTAVIAAGVACEVTRGEWTALVISIGLVWSAEALNSAIELLADRITTRQDDLVRRSKDAAAAGVLLASVAAAVTGMIVLGPKLWAAVRGT